MRYSEYKKWYLEWKQEGFTSAVNVKLYAHILQRVKRYRA